MARTKAFEPQKALDAALEVFWTLGYDNASLEVLLAAMGIAKQSLYDTFGDKRALFMLAMQQYRRNTITSMQRMLATAPTVREGFAALLHGLAAETREQHERGCLLLSANLQRNLDDEAVASFLQENNDEVESVFCAALRQAQQRGELRAEADPQALARFLIVSVQGMRAMARLKSDRAALAQVADLALAALH